MRLQGSIVVILTIYYRSAFASEGWHSVEFYAGYKSGLRKTQLYSEIEQDFFQKKSSGFVLGGAYSYNPKTPLTFWHFLRIELLAGIDSLYIRNKQQYQGGVLSLESYQLSLAPAARFIAPYFFIEPFAEFRIYIPLFEKASFSSPVFKVELEDPRYATWGLGLRTKIASGKSVFILYEFDSDEATFASGLGYTAGVSYDI